MSAPRISIVTPCLNHVRWIDHAIRSVLDQGYGNLEYVVVDGGSTDGSRDVIARYGERLSSWVSEPDRGHGHALNKGFARTTGDIMGWLNSDDMYLPWTLRTVAEIFDAHPEVRWITGFQAKWDAEGRLTNAFQHPINVYDFLLGRFEWIQQEGTFWRRSLWDEAGGGIDESYEFMVDGELWSRFFLHAKLHHVGCILGGFRAWGGNRSHGHLDTCRAEMRRAIGVMRERCAPRTRDVARVLRTAAGIAKALRGFPVQRAVRLALPGYLNEAGYLLLRPSPDGFTVAATPYRV